MRTAAMRFVDVLPALQDNEDLTAHLDEYFGDFKLPIPMAGLAHWGIKRSRSEFASGVVAPFVRATAERMARRFIAGDNVHTAEQSLRRLYRNGMGFTLDLLGEAVVSEAEAKQYDSQYHMLLDELTPFVQNWPGNDLLDTISGRRSPRLNLSLKITALYSQFTPLDPEGVSAEIKDRLRPLLRKARKLGAFITLDMEQYDTKETTLRVFKEILSEDEFLDWPDVGIAIQAYLRDTPNDLRSLIEWARGRGTPVTVRLVRGAYWDYETIVGKQHGWRVPVWSRKSQTDLCYEQCLRMLFEHYPAVETAVGTHNVRSLAVAMALAEQLDMDPTQYEMQMLYGMADALKGMLVESGQRLRVYVPFGELIPGMAYLVRRLLENTASQSFLRMGFTEDVPAEQLLAPPPPDACHEPVQPKNGKPTPDDESTFHNTSIRRFTDAAERDLFGRALKQVRESFGGEHALIIGGQRVWTDGKLSSINPAKPSEVIGTTASAGRDEARQAVESASRAFAKWRDTPVEDRVAIILRCRDLLRERRERFSAVEVFEAGKPWQEADADVVEAIDFLGYYAHQMRILAESVNLDVSGETNRYFYEPRGPGAVIAPWNFPLAILVGMSAAPIVAGNTIVMKPAPQTPIIAAMFADLMHEAGLPDGVLNFLPGGDDAGAAIVEHPDIHFINFTGSLKVGRIINDIASKVDVDTGQHHFKHVVAELGGKNALIIDSDADVDDAVLGVARSAFGFAGQKCSACSRVIVVGRLYDSFVQRLVEASSSLRIGPPAEPGSFMGPVIDQEAYDRIRATIDEAAEKHELLLRTDVAHLGDGYFIGPTVFGDVDPASDLAQQEIFGPVLATMRAKNFDEALAIANGTRYALTGGVYSRSPANLEKARRSYRVGNLYLNRTITGAIVNRQPFGGMKLSGTNAKAGGPDYLRQFLQPRTITENTMRRGFAPDAEH